MPRTGKKKLEKKKERERGSTGTFAQRELCVHGAGQEKGLDLEGWEGREGFWEQHRPRALPGASCSQMGLAVPSEGPSLPLECSRMALGAGIGHPEGLGAAGRSQPEQLCCCPHPRPHLSSLGITQSCHRLKGLGWTLETIPVPFPSLLGAGWTWSSFPQEGGWLQPSSAGSFVAGLAQSLTSVLAVTWY